ncbi:M24 family metallopeptidase [Tindallia californiensis]|uniref:Xaa-Pro aminopeptidase n=1 Tax=Tindallia californiensis TaxID=159292 RepID=A0A1H3NKQ1_9FIRM|nr:Xaa-Pro peptidase family protein [Tindallia californiensis]SDY89015.1 Xaa-Pro aminopeptidase [Tindallia californiensis]
MDRAVNKIREWIEENRADAVLITSEANRYYLSGFTGSTGMVLITKNSQFVLSDFRYRQQVREECTDLTFLMTDSQHSVSDHFKDLGIRIVGIEENKVSYRQAVELMNHHEKIKLVPLKNLIEKLRSIKTKDEIEKIEKAAALSDVGWEYIKQHLHPGKKEKDLALDLEIFLRRNGAENISFPVILASGHRSALPHGVASDKIIEDGDLITVDFGSIVNRYCSDMTRTLVAGQANDKQKEIYHVVLEAQTKALEAVKPGVSGKELDDIARNIITKAGYGEAFGHGLGHGVGLEVHELPQVSQKGITRLTPGMVITIEPGIYLPGVGGVRIEDLVLVTNEGYQVLSQSCKKLQEVG